ncbi:hypothetical protein [Bradyrhizobium sp. Ash2021]|uniref:hypothetical protein n=1 Tax=Bradyrhizobium sp. Ash2021 TaxID=2954771 RepID=UPI00281565E5|nr:hypothetical protein [Bradyrhizobium sp. Ash2021]WMT77363.1 hypothetical protein NL528_13845 [Bradyrhizobium sp. Ash2021]
MTEITQFMVVPCDYVDGEIVAGDPISCASPAEAIQRAQGLWKTFGHAGAVAFSRTSDFEIGMFNVRKVLRRFGHVPSEY